MEINQNNALNRVLSDYALPVPNKATDPKSALGRDEFLKLLIAQLENQDPTSPQENGEFVAQLAQFSQLEESQKMSESFGQFSSSFQSTQHLQATSLVGRPVHVESTQAFLGSQGSISVLADFGAATQASTLKVYNSNGEMVDQFALGQQTEGRKEFIWTGMDGTDQRYPQGMYTFEVQASNAGVSETLPIYLSANVNSVTIEPGGKLTLNLAGLGPRSMSDIVQIN
jgi:flagellar basal-body rod modification protein FlgD